MRRTGVVLTGAAVGALLGGLVGWFLIRPAGGDLVDAAEGLVPEGFRVEGSGLQEGNALLGWEEIGGAVGRAPDLGWQDVAVEDAVRDAGWDVVMCDRSDTGVECTLTRSGLRARFDLGTVDAVTEVDVQVRRDDAGGGPSVVVPAVVGAALGAVGAGAWLLRRRRRAGSAGSGSPAS